MSEDCMKCSHSQWILFRSVQYNRINEIEGNLFQCNTRLEYLYDIRLTTSISLFYQHHHKSPSQITMTNHHDKSPWQITNHHHKSPSPSPSPSLLSSTLTVPIASNLFTFHSIPLDTSITPSFFHICRYLENNEISSIESNSFQNLSQLQWL